MKAYVLRHSVDVELGPQPSQDWRYGSRQQAEAVCRDLNKLGVRTGSHQCSFAVDSLPDHDYGIICVCHPLFGSKRSAAHLLKGDAQGIR